MATGAEVVQNNERGGVMEDSKLTIDLMEYLDKGIKAKLTNSFDEMKARMIEELVAELDEKRSELIVNAAVRISRMFDIQTMNDQIIITVDTGARP